MCFRNKEANGAEVADVRRLTSLMTHSLVSWWLSPDPRSVLPTP